MSALISRVIHRQNGVSCGFSLSELLVAAALLLALVSLFGFAVVGQLSYSRNLNLRNRSSEAARRLGYLMEIEAGESRALDYGASMDGACGETPDEVYLAMTVPKPDEFDATNKIFYYQKGPDLWRCGPPFLANGRLNHGATSVAARLIAGASLVVYSDGSLYDLTDLPLCLRTADASSGGDTSGMHREYAYRIQQTVGGFTVDSADKLIKAKSFFVCDESSSSS